MLGKRCEPGRGAFISRDVSKRGQEQPAPSRLTQFLGPPFLLPGQNDPFCHLFPVLMRVS